MLRYAFEEDGKDVYGMVTGLQYARWAFGVGCLLGFGFLSAGAGWAVYRDVWWERKGKGLSMQVLVDGERREEVREGLRQEVREEVRVEERSEERRVEDSGWGGFKRTTVYR
jgi:hypothetical protein